MKEKCFSDLIEYLLKLQSYYNADYDLLIQKRVQNLKNIIIRYTYELHEELFWLKGDILNDSEDLNSYLPDDLLNHALQESYGIELNTLERKQKFANFINTELKHFQF